MESIPLTGTTPEQYVQWALVACYWRRRASIARGKTPDSWTDVMDRQDIAVQRSLR